MVVYLVPYPRPYNKCTHGGVPGAIHCKPGSTKHPVLLSTRVRANKQRGICPRVLSLYTFYCSDSRCGEEAWPYEEEARTREDGGGAAVHLLVVANPVDATSAAVLLAGCASACHASELHPARTRCCSSGHASSAHPAVKTGKTQRTCPLGARPGGENEGIGGAQQLAS